MMMNEIEEYFEYLFPNPKCELLYKKDYELLIAIVLSAQSTDKRVNSVTPILFSKYRNLFELKDANLEDLEIIIKSIGSFHKKAIYVKEIARMIVEEFGGLVPKKRELLIRLPGVGRKTVNVFLSEFYNEPAIAVDTHVERISKRLGLVSYDADVLTIENELMKLFSKDDWGRRHLQMVLFGRYYCKAIKPLCRECRLSLICLFKKNH